MAKTPKKSTRPSDASAKVHVGQGNFYRVNGAVEEVETGYRITFVEKYKSKKTSFVVSPARVAVAVLGDKGYLITNSLALGGCLFTDTLSSVLVKGKIIKGVTSAGDAVMINAGLVEADIAFVG